MAAATTLGLQTCLALRPEAPGSEAGWAAELGPISIAAGGFLLVCLFCCWFFVVVFWGVSISVVAGLFWDQSVLLLLSLGQSILLFIFFYSQCLESKPGPHPTFAVVVLAANFTPRIFQDDGSVCQVTWTGRGEAGCPQSECRGNHARRYLQVLGFAKFVSLSCLNILLRREREST